MLSSEQIKARHDRLSLWKDIENSVHENLKANRKYRAIKPQSSLLQACELTLDYSQHRIHSKQLKTLQQNFHHFYQQGLHKESPSNVFNTLLKHMELRKTVHSDWYRSSWDAICQLTDRYSHIKHWVCLGIGGSYYGIKLLSEALHPYHVPEKKIFFISGCDGFELSEMLNQIPQHSLGLVITSKSFKTRETLLNAQMMKQWMGKSFHTNTVIITENIEAAVSLGVTDHQILSLPPWLVGRCSIWSAVSFAAIQMIGIKCFQEFLQGGEAMDHHFMNQINTLNMPVILALLSVWYINGHHLPYQAIIPYCHLLRTLPAYCKQLAMESLGKEKTLDHEACPYSKGYAVLGDLGCQHHHTSLQYWLESGAIIPTDFILPTEAHPIYPELHQFTQTSCLAQRKINVLKRNFQPNNLITFKTLTPRTLGNLVALYELKTYVESVMWHINPYDQPSIDRNKSILARLLKRNLKV